MGTWFVPAQPRTKPGVSPIRTTFPSKWCRVRWFLNGLAWRMALSCHSQVNHRGGGSDATLLPGSWTGQPQPHRCGGHCRWPVTQVAGGVPPSASLWAYTATSESAGSSVPYSFYFLFFFLSLSFTSRYRSVLILLLLPWCNACYTLRLSLTPPPFQQPWNFNPTQVQSL